MPKSRADERGAKRAGADLCVVLDPEAADDETVLDAARACPVDAITVMDEYEDQIWPG